MESKLLTIHFPLPEGYKSADQYLKSIVEEQIQKRYNNTLEGLDERLLRAKSAVLRQDLKEYERNIIADLLEFASALNLAKEELASIKKKQLADRYLMIWDYFHAAKDKGFLTFCEDDHIEGSIVAYCLGLTNKEPIRDGLATGEFSFPWIKVSAKGGRFIEMYLLEKYGKKSFPRRKSGAYDFDPFNFRVSYHADLIEFAIAAIGNNDRLDPSVLQTNSSEIEAWLHEHYREAYISAAAKAEINYQIRFNIIKRPNLLDFTTDGLAIIRMPGYRFISILENFGFSPIESVEEEIAQADSPERAAFLQHYVKTFKETYTSPPNSYITKGTEDDTIPVFSTIDDQTIRISKISLLHSSAWYMMYHVDAEIAAVKRHLEELDGRQVAKENLEEVIRTIRQSKNSEDACSRLQKRFEIGIVKARYILNLPLTKLTTSTLISTAIEKEDYQKRLEFLQKLQPNGVMGAMYFK